MNPPGSRRVNGENEPTSEDATLIDLPHYTIIPNDAAEKSGSKQKHVMPRVTLSLVERDLALDIKPEQLRATA